MERTIDGIDYIAKSEVLRIINESADRALSLSKSEELSAKTRHAWGYVRMEMCELLYQLDGVEER